MPGGAHRHISLVAHTAIVLPDYLQHSCDLTLYRLATPHYPRSISHTNIDFSNVYDPCVFPCFSSWTSCKTYSAKNYNILIHNMGNATFDAILLEPALDPPPGVVADFANPGGSHNLGYGIVIATSAIAFIAVAARLVSSSMAKKFVIEDFLMVAALVSSRIWFFKSPRTEDGCMLTDS